MAPMHSHDDSVLFLQPYSLAALFTALFAVILGSLLAWSPLIPYAYGETSALHLLFAQGFFHATPWDGLAQTPLPWGNMHPLALAILESAKATIGLHWVSLWLLQTVVAGLFAFRLAAWLWQWLSPNMTLAALILTLAHPATWMTLLFSPVNALTAWLFVEALIALHRRRGFRRMMLAIGALAWCGPMGMLFALAICASLTASNNWRTLHSRRQIIIAWMALTPAVFWLGAQSLYWSADHWGALGGPVLVDYPTLYSSISLTTLLGGIWGETLRSSLVWFGHGGIDLPFTAPVIGAMGLLGGFAALQGNDNQRRVAHASFIALFLFTLMGAFLPFAAFREQALPAIVLLLSLATIGAIRALESLGSFATKVCVTATLAYLTLLVAVHPFAFQPIWEEAQHRHGIAASLEEKMGDQRAALLFSPHHFAGLNGWERIEPLGLRIAAPMHSPAGRQGGFVHQASERPLTILFPTTEQARRGASALDALRNRMAFEIPEEASITHYRNLTLIESPSQVDLSETASQLSLYDESLTADAITHDVRQNGFLLYGSDAKTLMPSSRFMPNEKTVGMRWNFESGYENTQQVGISFGMSPTMNASANGLRSAGPPPGTHRPGLGSLESVPFPIEGEELRFWANLPVSSTSAFFALAVHSEAPIGLDKTVRRAEHLYHYQIGDPLMDNVFYYVRPEELEYGPDSVQGWRVVRLIHGGGEGGWRSYHWSIDAWREKQAVWHAAHRGAGHPMWIDDIEQWMRPDGLYWNFEDGTYSGWIVDGESFGDAPAVGPYGAQQPIEGFEGNYFVNSFHQGSDEAHGRMATEPFILEYNRMRFLVGGGDDVERLYIGLRVDDEVVLRAAGERTEILREKEWNLTPWVGSEVQIEIVDATSDPWGHILVDDIRLDNYGVYWTVDVEQ